MNDFRVGDRIRMEGTIARDDGHFYGVHFDGDKRPTTLLHERCAGAVLVNRPTPRLMVGSRVHTEISRRDGIVLHMSGDHAWVKFDTGGTAPQTFHKRRLTVVSEPAWGDLPSR